MGLIVYPRPSRYPSRNKNDFEYKPYFIRCYYTRSTFAILLLYNMYIIHKSIWKPSRAYIYIETRTAYLRINNGDVVASNCLLWLCFTAAARTLMSQNSRNMYKLRVRVYSRSRKEYRGNHDVYHRHY